MANKKQFVNPLTRSSEEDLNLSQSLPDGEGGEQPKADEVKKEKRERFEATHQRFTVWIDQELKKQLDALASDRGISKTALLDEAITLLLSKDRRKPYVWQGGKDLRDLKGKPKKARNKAEGKS